MLLMVRTSWLLVFAVASLGMMANSYAEVVVENGYVRGLPPGQPNTAAFMHLVNSGEEAVVIHRACSSAAESAEFHAHRHEGGMMRMEQVESITVPPKGRFVLAPGEHHLMLLNLERPLREGDDVTLELFTVDGVSIQTTLPVRSVLNEHHHH